MDNNAIYQTLNSIKNEIYQKINMSEYFLLDENTTTKYINTINNLKTRRFSLKKNEDKNQIDSYKELLKDYLNEILIIHENIFNNEEFDTKILVEHNKQFINDTQLLGLMVKPSDTRKADDERKATRTLTMQKNDFFDFSALDNLQKESNTYSRFNYRREQTKKKSNKPKSNTVSCDKYSKKYKTFSIKIKQLKKTINYNINKIDNFKNKNQTQISNIINNPKGEKIFWSKFSVIPRNFEDNNIRDLVNKKYTSNKLFDKINPFSVRNKTSRKINKIKKQNESAANSILQKYRDVLQGIYDYINNNMFEKWPNINIDKFYEEYSTLCNTEKIYNISKQNIADFKFNVHDLKNWYNYYNNLKDFNYDLLSKINLSIEGICLLQEEFHDHRYEIMHHFDIKHDIEKQLQDLINEQFFPYTQQTIVSDIFTLCHKNKYIIEDWKNLKFDIIDKIKNNPINSTTEQLNSDDKEQLRILEDDINSIYNRDKTQQISSKLQRDKKELEELLLRKKMEILKKYIKKKPNVTYYDPNTAIGGRKRKTRRKGKKRRRKTRRKGKR